MVGEIKQARSRPPELPDFPRVYRWTEGKQAISRPQRLVAAIPPQTELLRFSTDPPLPGLPQPLPHIKEETDKAALIMYSDAIEWIQKGRYLAAEDALTGCIALSYHSGGMLSRAMAYQALLTVQMQRKQKQLFLPNVGRFLDIFERLVSSDPSLLPLSTENLTFVGSYLETLVDEESARPLLLRMRTLIAAAASGQQVQ